MLLQQYQPPSGTGNGQISGGGILYFPDGKQLWLYKTEGVADTRQENRGIRCSSDGFTKPLRGDRTVPPPRPGPGRGPGPRGRRRQLTPHTAT